MDKQTFIKIWGTMAGLARAIGEGETTVRNWFTRGSIPTRYDDKIMMAAARQGRGITPVELYHLRRSIANKDDAA